jgi:SAM-dependent methyltransferase
MTLRSLATIREHGRCLDIGGGSGRLADAAHEMRPDVRWIVADSADQARSNNRSNRSVQVVQADGVALPVRTGAVDWVAFVSSLHYIGLTSGLREAHRCMKPNATLVITAKVGDQFSDHRDWHLRLHHLRSLVPRSSLNRLDFVAALDAHGFELTGEQRSYNWCEYDYETWLSRGGDLSPDTREALREHMLEAYRVVAVDGVAPMIVERGVLKNRIEWLCLEARLVHSRG